LHKGRLVFDGAKGKLEHMFGNKRMVEVKFVPNAQLDFNVGKVLYNSRELSIIAKIKPKPFSKEDLDFFKDMGFDVRKVSIDYNGARGLSV